MNDLLGRIRAGYDEWVMLIFGGFALVYIYFASTNLGLLVFLWGVFCIAHLRSFRGFVPAAALSGFLLLYAFLRSDFVAMVVHGMGISQAYAASTRYFQAPLVIWFAAWAMILAFRDLPGEKTGRLIGLLSWGVLGLGVIQLFDGVTGFALRNAVNNLFHHGHRPEMLVVRTSNANTVLLMLFWPLGYYHMRRGQYGQIGFMLLSLIVTAFAVDTNSQLLALALGGVVFAAARFWPQGWGARGVTPERVMAVLTSLTILGFPPLIRWLMDSGLAYKIKTELLRSWADRIDIWTFAVARGSEKPWFGWGYEASRQFDPHIPNHPHSLSLQAWLELGIPGLVALAGLWFCIFWFMAPGTAIAKAEPDQGLRDLDARAVVTEGLDEQLARPWFLAAAAGYLAINMVSFGLWRMWYYCLGALTVSLALLVVKAAKRLQN